MKNELTKRIFIACIVMFLLCFGMMVYMMGISIRNRNIAALHEQAKQAEQIMADSGTEALRTLHAAVTVAAADGSILYDSTGNTGSLAGLEVFEEARADGSGMDTQYMDMALAKVVTYAELQKDGSVLCVTQEQDTLFTVLSGFWNELLILIMLTLLLSVLLAAGFSRRIMKPINQMDADNPFDRDVYDEMKPFVRKLMTQNQQIHKQMEALKEEHKKQDAMRRELTANISHELKTPLTSISGFAEIIRDGMVKEKDIPHFADNIYKEAQRLITLVNDILKISHLEDIDASSTVEYIPVELLRLCQDVTKRLMLNAKKNDLTLTCEGTEVMISGVPLMLEDIVGNICDNAIRYNHPGGTVEVHVGTEDGRAFVKVKDDGIGIPAADQERIFERFYRVNKSHSREVGGTGLGLSIVKHGVALHGGDIAVQSAPGVGTEITIFFPLLNISSGEMHTEK